EPQFFLLGAHIDEALAMFAVQASDKNLVLKLECDPSLANTEVFTDPHRLRQILLNLIGNAVKFTEKGSITLKVVCGRAESGDRRLRYQVADTGPGIEAADVDRLFQRFSRVASANSQSGGTGLGLAICKGIVEAMDGEIGVSTKPGSGSCF